MVGLFRGYSEAEEVVEAPLRGDVGFRGDVGLRFMREKLISITIDYETWNPLPEGKTVDWERDIFRPTELLFALGERCCVPVTLFAEMGEYLWLERYEPETAARMAAQLREAAVRGHDVQLHLHPNWLPESGAKVENGRWSWDPLLQVPGLYPGDLTALIARCKEKLEEIIQIINRNYRVSCFRCGGYSAQPFRRVYDALIVNGICCDSSVYQGGRDSTRGYDFRAAWSAHQPYFADPYDPQLRAPTMQRGIVELPIFAWDVGRRWCLDGDGAENLGVQLQGRFTRASALGSMWCRSLLEVLEVGLWPPCARRVVEAKVRAALRIPIAEDSLPSDYFVMIGHTKAHIDYCALERSINEMRAEGYRFEPLNLLARRAREELDNFAKEPTCNVEARGTSYVFSQGVPLSDEFTDRIPLDRTRILLLRQTTCHVQSAVARLRPWASVVESHISDIEFRDETFDCVYGPQFLDTHPDPDAMLTDAYRMLANDGLFLTTLPQTNQEGRLFSQVSGSNAVVNTMLARIEKAGFVNVATREIAPRNDFFFPADQRTRRRFRDAIKDVATRRLPWHPWRSRSRRWVMLYGWKRPHPVTAVRRALEAMDWVYRRLAPEPPANVGLDPHALIIGGKGLCIDYCIVLGAMLQNEGFDVQWITMVAHDHPCGWGELRQETHEVLQLRVNDRHLILDPTTNSWYEAELMDLLRTPSLATGSREPDPRYVDHRYALYDTAEWYSRVVEYFKRKDIAVFTSFSRRRRNPYNHYLREHAPSTESRTN